MNNNAGTAVAKTILSKVNHLLVPVDKLNTSVQHAKFQSSRLTVANIKFNLIL